MKDDKTIGFVDGTLFNQQLQMADVMAKSGLLPKTLDTKEKVFIALQWGVELGLSPMVAVTNIAVVNGRPTLSADIMYAIVRNNPDYAGIEWRRKDNTVADVVIKRRNGNAVEEFNGHYDIDMAKRAGLFDKENWRKYPERMLKHRALSFALRDAFPDVLAGLYNPDEMADTTPQAAPPAFISVENVTPAKKTTLPPPADSSSGNAAATEKTDAQTNEDFYNNETKKLLLQAAELKSQLSEDAYKFYAEKLENLKLIKNAEKRFNETLVIVGQIKTDIMTGENEQSLEIF